MSDLDILMFGCAVTFLACAGSYVILRERYLSPRMVKARIRRRGRDRRAVRRRQAA